MGFLFIYEPSEYRRIIPAILIDKRAAIPAISNKTGFEIKAYTDREVAKVDGVKNVLFFKIETVKNKTEIADGVLVGYFSIRVFVSPVLMQYELRPQFEQFSAHISAEISIFISAGLYKEYML